MRVLLIDDLRDFIDPPADYDIARTSDEAIRLLSVNNYTGVFWDHDLGGEDTTMKVVSWLLENAIRDNRIEIGDCIIHTSNPVGAVNLKNALESRFLRYKTIRLNAPDYFIVR